MQICWGKGTDLLRQICWRRGDRCSGANLLWVIEQIYWVLNCWGQIVWVRGDRFIWGRFVRQICWARGDICSGAQFVGEEVTYLYQADLLWEGDRFVRQICWGRVDKFICTDLL